LYLKYNVFIDYFSHGVTIKGSLIGQFQHPLDVPCTTGTPTHLTAPGRKRVSITALYSPPITSVMMAANGFILKSVVLASRSK
jgi:hypothetical protein